MRHHNRRATRYHVLPYVLYDMILLRQSSLGNHIQSRNDYWKHGQVNIMSLSFTTLREATTKMAKGETCKDPVINRLLHNLWLISSYNPESFGRKLVNCHILIGHVIQFSALAFWFTLNPADLNNPVILRITGVII